MDQFGQLLPSIAGGYTRVRAMDMPGLQGGYDFTLKLKGQRYRGDDVFFGGHSAQAFPAVDSIGIGPTSEKPGTTAPGCRGGAGM
jgi:hypothetical protein